MPDNMQQDNKPPRQLSGYGAELGPYGKDYDFQVRAFVTHTGGGDDSTASMKLFYGGVEVGNASDRSFHVAPLDVRYSFRLERGSTASLAITTENHKATVGPHGFDFTWS